MSKQPNVDLSEPRIRSLFEGKNFAFLSSLMKDGSPHVTPVWVDFEDGNILVNTALGRVKQRNISRDPKVALSIIDQNNQYEMVTLRGKVTEQITGDRLKNILIGLLKNILARINIHGDQKQKKGLF
jgi:PPOX class probable F420-dependent enzyme